MNVLPFVVAILMILSYSAAGLLQKHITSAHAQKAYMGLQNAERSILRQAEQQNYAALQGEAVQKTVREKRAEPQKPRVALPPKTNVNCARLNLFPLAAEGRERHPALYKAAAELLRIFYQETLFKGQDGLEKTLLDALLTATKKRIGKETSIPLETLKLGDESMQHLYYLALKGTKRADVVLGKGYPPLLEAFKIERGDSQVCLYHAHPNMLAGLFGAKSASKLFEELHGEHNIALALPGIQALTPPKEPDFWKLVEGLGPRGGGCKSGGGTTFLAEDAASGVVVRREIGKS